MVSYFTHESLQNDQTLPVFNNVACYITYVYSNTGMCVCRMMYAECGIWTYLARILYDKVTVLQSGSGRITASVCLNRYNTRLEGGSRLHPFSSLSRAVPPFKRTGYRIYSNRHWRAAVLPDQFRRAITITTSCRTRVNGLPKVVYRHSKYFSTTIVST